MKIDEGVRLSRLTTLGTGGPALAFARPETVDELQEALGFARERGLPVAALGLGSNLLVADRGFEGLALKLGGDLAQVDVLRQLRPLGEHGVGPPLAGSARVPRACRAVARGP